MSTVAGRDSHRASIMNGFTYIPDDACDEVCRIIEEQLDGVRFADSHERSAEEHLAECDQCRDYRDDMLAVRDRLRSLPLIPLPDDALDAVLSRTVGGDPAGQPVRYRRVGLTRFATAAALVMGVLLPWFILNPPNTAVRESETNRAVVEAHYVLDVVAGALHRAERAALSDVLGGRLAPALQRVSFDWSNFPLPIVRRSGT